MKVIVCLFVFAISFVATADEFIYRRAHSLYPPYVDNNLQNKFWTFGGDTVISTYSFVQLTTEKASKAGWLFSNNALNATNWSVEFQFSVNGANKKVFGDGFAFWFVQQPFSAGSYLLITGEAFGYTPTFKGLGVFFDTFPNKEASHSFPYVSGMVGDGNLRYNHMDDGSSTEIGGCEADFRDRAYSTRAKITYISKSLEVFLDIDGQDEWKSCFRIPNVELSPSSYVGFSSTTGEVFDSHKILSVTTVEVLPNPNSAFFLMPGEGSKSKSTFLVLIIFLGIAGGIFYYVRKAQMQKSRF